jgi:hypothetical protein
MVISGSTNSIAFMVRFNIDRYTGTLVAKPYNVAFAFGQIGGIIAIIGVVGLLLYLMHYYLIMKSLRQHIVAQVKASEDKKNAYRSLVFLTDEEEKIQKEIRSIVSFERIYQLSKEVDELKQIPFIQRILDE